MKHLSPLVIAFALLSAAQAQDVKRNIPYADPAHERQVVDVYSPPNAKNLPVVFWIHGGGWQTGDKTSVQTKPQAFVDKGFVFVSTNYRLLPGVDMATIVRDIAKSIRWVHDHIAKHGGDPQRLFVMGHSAGAQLAALVCTDDRYLKAEGLSLAIIKGCVPVDGDTYDVPAMIETAETRRRVHGLPQATFGHREKFGNDPAKHRDFSAVTHVAKNKGIPPFLILHVAEHPDTTAQAQRLGNVLKDAGVPVTVFGAKETNHTRINAELGVTDDPATKALFEFVIRLSPPAVGRPAEPNPPEGFRAIFNGRDLAGWHGLNPHSVAKLTGEKKTADLAQQRAEFPKSWSVENGELVNDGHGHYATTDEEFGDIELRIEYKTVPKADSGIYLRGTPQVQIWDWNQVFDPKAPTRKPHLGSGGLFNNTPGAAGRDPLLLADRPFGEWNHFRIRQIGDRTWVWLNDKLVVDGAAMENYWDRSQPLPAKGPIMLQTHGGEIRWRNIFVRAIAAEEAKQTLSAADGEVKARLAKALTLHASFDTGLAADFARGDKTCYVQQGKELVTAAPTDEVRLSPEAGRFGGALHFTKKNNFRPAFKDAGALGYNDKGWNATVSVWLRLNPDEDLEPGYCDPVQIVGDDSKKGFIFLEWSKDETPRFFRYAIRPLFHIWNPDNVQWADIPFEKRPMVQVARAPFSRDAWTHAVFTLENINDRTRPQSGRLYLNGKLQGAIEKWDLTFGWDPAQVLLVLGAAYVGHMDDLAVFNRVLTAGEVQHLYGLKAGVRELRF